MPTETYIRFHDQQSSKKFGPTTATVVRILGHIMVEFLDIAFSVFLIRTVEFFSLCRTRIHMHVFPYDEAAHHCQGNWNKYDKYRR